MNTLQAGDKAPLFKLADQNGEMVELAELLKENKVLVYFYPKDSTPGCTIESRNFSAEYKKIAENPPEKLTKDFIIAHSGDKHGTAEEHHKNFPDGRVGSHSAMANPKIGKKIVNASVEGFLKEIERLNSTLL